MRSLKEIKEHYHLTAEDERKLSSIRDLMTQNVDGAMEALRSWMAQIDPSSRFFTEKKKEDHVFTMQRKWFLELFSGRYDSSYYDVLIRIGQKHMKSQVESHYLNRAVNIMRNFCIGTINSHIEDTEERTGFLIALEKILDINLDIITSSYIEAELGAYAPAYRVKNALITFAEGFSQTMNLVLVLALMGLTFGVVGLFVNDVKNLFSGSIENGLITALGTMLILWMLIELMGTEISNLKGGKFHISVFVGVALVTMIRETMIATLKHERPESIYYLVAAILVVGVVYWLVKKTEGKES